LVDDSFETPLEINFACHVASPSNAVVGKAAIDYSDHYWCGAEEAMTFGNVSIGWADLIPV
jgi:hypothetical protein